MKRLMCQSASPAFSSTDLTIESLGIRETLQKKVNDIRHGRGNYLLMYFHTEAVIMEDGNPKVVPAQSLIIWEPWTRIYYGNLGRDWTHSWINISGQMFTNLLELNAIPVNRAIEFPQFTIMDKYLLDLYAEIKNHIAPERTIIHNILTNWCCEIRRTLDQLDVSHTIASSYIKTRNLIELNFRDRILLDELAKEACCSPQHFCTTFRNIFGVSPKKYQVQVRMRQAVYLLHDFNLSISEVGEQVGYDDLFYFSSRFKDYHGISPRKMRESFSRNNG